MIVVCFFIIERFIYKYILLYNMTRKKPHKKLFILAIATLLIMHFNYWIGIGFATIIAYIYITNYMLPDENGRNKKDSKQPK